MIEPTRRTDGEIDFQYSTEVIVTFPDIYDIIEYDINLITQWSLKELKERFPVSDEQSENKI